MSRLKPRRSIQRRYIRRSISAQSCDSVPPAPGWIVDDRVLAIVLAAEHLLDLAGLHFLLERVERLTELGVDRLARLGPFDEHGEIVALLLERRHQLVVLLQATAALQDLLRVRLIFPEIGRRRRAPRGGLVLLQDGRLQR